MGTNFYLRQTACGGCGRYDEYHIGKRSAGWSFAFRGYRPDEDITQPLGVIVSRADWVKAVEGFDGLVFDEYGNEVAAPAVWLREMAPPSAQQQVWELDHMGPFYRPSDRDWRDPEGFRFYGGEFS